MSEASQLEMAEQQLLGFAHAKQGFSVADLVDAMGLSEDEWNELHKQGQTHVNESDWNEVENYFAERRS
jgi:hypothetical protein